MLNIISQRIFVCAHTSLLRKNADGHMCENIVSGGGVGWYPRTVAMGEGSEIRIAIGNYVREKFNSDSSKIRQN